METQSLRAAVRGAYDIQKLRIEMGNRIVANFKARLGQEPGMKEEELDAEGKKILKAIRQAFKKITDGIKTFPRQTGFTGDELISDYTELCLVAQYVALEQQEAQHFTRLGSILKNYPIFSDYLDGVKGIGPAMGGVLVTEIDITKARYPSSLWKYAGLDVAADGRGRSRREAHLIDVDYTDKHGKPATRKSITFNPFLKTKLFVLASCFIRTKDSPYANIYRDYKHRMESHAVYGVANDQKRDEDDKLITSKGRRHNMAIRYMLKMFLRDLYVAWRPLEGLPVAPSYAEAKLKKIHAA